MPDKLPTDTESLYKIADQEFLAKARGETPAPTVPAPQSTAALERLARALDERLAPALAVWIEGEMSRRDRARLEQFALNEAQRIQRAVRGPRW